MRKHPVFTALPLAIAAFLMLAVSAMAQPMDRPGPQSKVDEMDKVLKLSDDQKTKILKLYTDAETNMSQSRPGGAGGPGGPGRGGMMMGSPADDDAEKILTPEQAAAWREYTLNQRIDRRISMIDQAVTLTDSQKVLLRPVIGTEIAAQRDLVAQMRAGGNAGRETMRGKMGEIRGATAKSLESILTKEQLEKYNAMPSGGMRRP